MTSQNQNLKLSFLKPSVFRNAGIIAALAATVISCVNVELDPVVDYVVMEFDTTADPARVPEPNVIMINQETGLIDFSIGGLVIPEDCADGVELGLPMAQCEFYQYLEGLDGFPTLSPAKAPASAPIDMSTVSLADTLAVIEDTPSKWGDEKVLTEFDEEDNYLKVTPLAGWNVGKTYLVAVRGYDNGVVGAEGERVISSQAYFLLKEEESLMCEASTPSGIPHDCKYLELLATGTDEESAREQLASLEALRQGFLQAGVWDTLDVLGDMQKEEVAVVWAFPTHSGSVAELNPAAGMVPLIDENSFDNILIPVKGTVDASSVQAFHPVANPQGGVYLIDLTELMEGNDAGAFPIMTASYDPSREGVSMTTQTQLIVGHTYLFILSDRLENEAGEPFVPSPTTVFLRSHGELVNGEGESQVSSLDDDSAGQLEAGRVMLQELLDNEDFQNTTRLYNREKIVYLYALTLQEP